jgi:hypothetical protein
MGSSRTDATRPFFVQVLCAVAAVLLVFSLNSSVAWAEEEELPAATDSVDANGNVVNVNQMPDSSFLYNTDISELSGAESFHDTQTVQVTGEVVGDCINDETDSNLCWIELQSLKENDSSSVSVLMSRDQAALIDRYGNYQTNGTELQVRGVFYLTCPDHEGLSDLHAQEVTVTAAGSDRANDVNPAVFWVSFLAVGLGLLCLFTYRFLCERRK